jgi:hypothetical protein
MPAKRVVDEPPPKVATVDSSVVFSAPPPSVSWTCSEATVASELPTITPPSAKDTTGTFGTESTLQQSKPTTNETPKKDVKEATNKDEKYEKNEKKEKKDGLSEVRAALDVPLDEDRKKWLMARSWWDSHVCTPANDFLQTLIPGTHLVADPNPEGNDWLKNLSQQNIDSSLSQTRIIIPTSFSQVKSCIGISHVAEFLPFIKVVKHNCLDEFLYKIALLAKDRYPGIDSTCGIDSLVLSLHATALIWSEAGRMMYLLANPKTSYSESSIIKNPSIELCAFLMRVVDEAAKKFKYTDSDLAAAINPSNVNTNNTASSSLRSFTGSLTEGLTELIGPPRMEKMDMLMLFGEQSRCHDNVEAFYQVREIKQRWTGVALSKDRLWRMHSWGVNDNNQIIETTEPRLAYIGSPIPDNPPSINDGSSASSSSSSSSSSFSTSQTESSIAAPTPPPSPKLSSNMSEQINDDSKASANIGGSSDHNNESQTPTLKTKGVRRKRNSANTIVKDVMPVVEKMLTRSAARLQKKPRISPRKSHF